MSTYKISESIRREIAEAIVNQSDPGFAIGYAAEAYAVDTNGDGTLDTVYLKEPNAPWNPWHDNAVAISVEDIYAEVAASFDPTPDMDEPEELNEEEWAEAYFKEAVDFAVNEQPATVEIE